MLVGLLYANASAAGDADALVHGAERWTNRELVESVERLAGGLTAEGVQPGDAVALVLPNHPNLLLSFYALAALGAVVVPLSPGLKQYELEHCLTQADVRAVVTDGAHVGACQQAVARCCGSAVVIETSARRGGVITLAALMEAPRVRPVDVRPTAPLMTMFSSGSTGRPKRVMRTHEQCHAEAESLRSLGSVRDKIFCTTPLFHTYGAGCCMFAAAATGATLVMLEKPNPFVLCRQRALEVMEREGVTIYPGVPLNFRLLAEAPGSADVSSLRLCFSAGTALPRTTFDAFRTRFGVSIRQLYGCTEAGTIAANVAGDPVSSFDSVGKPLDMVDVRILADDGAPAAAGCVGEVAVSSPALMDGYVDAEEENELAFRDGYFLTGDVGRLDADGRLAIVGRRKLIIDVGGYKVDPLEIEDVISAHPRVLEAVVVGTTSSIAGEELIKAVVVPNGHVGDAELTDFCRSRLANFKVPAVFEFRPTIPRSPLGKVLRKDLM